MVILKFVLSVLLLLLIAPSFSIAQDFTMKAEHPVAEKITIQQWGLKGKVKKIALFEKASYKDTMLVKDVLEFDSKGRIIKKEEYFLGRVSRTYSYSYNDVKKEIAITNAADDAGKLYKLKHDGKYNVIEKVEALNKAYVRATKFAYNNNLLVVDSFFVVDEEAQKTGNFLVKVNSYTYNNIRQLSSVREIAGTDTTNITYRYKVEKEQVVVSIVRKATYKYKHEFKTETSRSVHYYDMKGNLTKEDRGTYSGGFFRFEYENDATGNWITENKGEKKRMIEYY